jgi:hypothetical protein
MTRPARRLLTMAPTVRRVHATAARTSRRRATSKRSLHGPRGDLNGVLLEDGTIVRLPPEEADRLAAQLAPGQPLYVEGDGIAGPLGKVIAAQQVGPSQSQLAQV